MADFWATLDQLNFDNEASVEHYLIQPMLTALGYAPTDISPKHPVVFQEGRVGRKPEADFVIFYGQSRSKDVSLITIEAKNPKEKLDGAKLQCESYAFNLRTPFIVLTNGIEIEIWQLQATWESTLLLKENVKDMANSRGKIESLISKDSAYNYAKQLAYKNFSEIIQDFSIYENSVLQRYIKSIHAIERRLSKTEETQQKIFSTLNLLEEFSQGAIILGSSGYGKTTIHNYLLLKAVSSRQNNHTQKLAIDIYLPDLAVNGSSIFEFTFKRIKAHQPTLAESQLTDILRSDGFIFLFDAFDRLKEIDQKPIVSEIINLQRDYPLVQIFIFSRAIATPRLGLEILKVESLCYDEQIRFIESIFNKNGQILTEYSNFKPSSFIHLIPPILKDFCSYPLLLELIVKYWLLNKAMPINIIPLFQSWLESSLVACEKSVIEYTHLEEALLVISYETKASPISKSELIGLFKKNEISLDLLNQLINLDSIHIQGNSIEIKHEALADYLRIKKIILDNNEKFIKSLINNTQLKVGSLFPILLIAMLPTIKLQKKLWRHLSNLDIEIYVNALKYRGDSSKEIIKLEDITLFFLEEIVDGIELPLKGFLPKLEDIIINDILNNKGSKLAVTGNISENLSCANYTIHPQGDRQKRINIGDPSQYNIEYGINLNSSKYNINSGRTIGSKYLLQRLFRVIESRKIIGGTTYYMERLVSRLRYINHDYTIKTQPFDSFDKIITQLTPYDGSYVPITYNRDNSYFAIADLLSDINYLKNEGLNLLDSWWLRLGYKCDLDIHDEKQITDVVTETFNRIQLIYKELVENSFFSIREQFGFYMALPVRWDVYITQSQCNSLSLNHTWLPVASWNDIGANVYFTEPPASNHSQERNNLRSTLLKQLGREKAQSYTIGGFSPFFSFDGISPYSGKLHGETPALQKACELIENDIKRIFSYLTSDFIKYRR